MSQNIATLEEWRDVAQFEGIYQVSDRGRVRRIGGGVRGAVVGRVLRPGWAKNRIEVVALGTAARPRTENVHRLVAEAFLGPCPDGHEVNHLDGDRRNNRLSNLEYVTHSENLRHSYRTGLRVVTPRQLAALGVRHE